MLNLLNFFFFGVYLFIIPFLIHAKPICPFFWYLFSIKFLISSSENYLPFSSPSPIHQEDKQYNIY